MLSPAMARDVEQLIALRDEEQALRQQARFVELIPTPAARAAAQRLFMEASLVRAERMELLDRCGLS
jgi:hypothetical protein